MAIVFNADEIFEMAIRIENNGAAFYRKAAGLQSDTKNHKFLESLAKMEDHGDGPHGLDNLREK
jgi:rubrerythrin